MTSFNEVKMEGAGRVNQTPKTGRVPVEPDHGVRLEDGIVIDGYTEDLRRMIIAEVGLTSPLEALLFLRGELDIEDIGNFNPIAEIRNRAMNPHIPRR